MSQRGTRPIVKGLRAGLDSDLAAVAILSDRPDADGLCQLGYTAMNSKS